MEQKNLNDTQIKTIHVLLAILLDPDNIVTSSFERIHINYEIIFDEYTKQLKSDISARIDDDMDDPENDDNIFGSQQRSEKSTKYQKVQHQS